MASAPPLVFVCSKSPKWVPWKMFISPGKLCNSVKLNVSVNTEMSRNEHCPRPLVPTDDDQWRTSVLLSSTPPPQFTFCFRLDAACQQRETCHGNLRGSSAFKNKGLLFQNLPSRNPNTAVLRALPLTASSSSKKLTLTAREGQQSVNWCINWRIFHLAVCRV